MDMVTSAASAVASLGGRARDILTILFGFAFIAALYIFGHLKEIVPNYDEVLVRVKDFDRWPYYLLIFVACFICGKFIRLIGILSTRLFVFLISPATWNKSPKETIRFLFRQKFNDSDANSYEWPIEAQIFAGRYRVLSGEFERQVLQEFFLESALGVAIIWWISFDPFPSWIIAAILLYCVYSHRQSHSLWLRGLYQVARRISSENQPQASVVR